MRSFIAIELPDTAKSVLADLQQELKKCGADIRWADPANIHLTLKFLGDIKEETAGKIIGLMQEACRTLDPFNISLRGLGLFPGTRAPRVLWAGIGNSETLSGLHKELEDRMSSLGFKREKRRFAPHLTLGRFRSSKGRKCVLEKVRAREEHSFGTLRVRSLCLMKSELNPAGARHTRIREVPLDKSERDN